MNHFRKKTSFTHVAHRFYSNYRQLLMNVKRECQNANKKNSNLTKKKVRMIKLKLDKQMSYFQVPRCNKLLVM